MITKTPTYPAGLKAPKMPRKLELMRGPELVHNKLIHNQYGVMALSGGSLKFGHFEMMRNILNKSLDRNKMFAVWRIDAPYRPKTKHGQGKKLGGGVGGIDHYITPVKRGRMIIEVGGHVEYQKVVRTLMQIAQNLPFPALPVNADILKKWNDLDEEIKSQNENPLRWEWCIKNNILNCLQFVGKYDLEFAHMGPDCR